MNKVHKCTNTFDTTEFYVVWNDVTHSTFISLRILNWCLALFAADEDRFNLDIYQHRLLMRDTRHPFAYWPLSCVEVFGSLQRYPNPKKPVRTKVFRRKTESKEEWRTIKMRSHQLFAIILVAHLVSNGDLVSTLSSTVVLQHQMKHSLATKDDEEEEKKKLIRVDRIGLDEFIVLTCFGDIELSLI